MKTEEEWWRQKEADDAFYQKVDQQTAVIQMQQKNWLKKANSELLASPSSKREINLINLPPLTKRQ